MPSTKELRRWRLVSLVLLGVLLAWSLVAPFLWPPGGTPDDEVYALQPRDGQALWDFCTRQGAEDTEDVAWEV
jgi:hypothetical protein